MSHTENLTQEQYDILKVFLIGNFNVIFLNSNKSDVEEAFEITLTDGNIMGYFLNRDSLELRYSGNAKPIYEKIITKIHQINGNVESNNSHTDKLSNLDDLLDHMSSCDICKARLLEILNHAKP